VRRRRIGPRERSPAIVALADGGVVEVGSHDQLMAAKGFGHDR
jgi:ABC-type transport system involved in Fe-S cluster assembly fused permease/ATPase subunit